MANIKSAIKKIGQDKKRVKRNASLKARVGYLVTKLKKIQKDPEATSEVKTELLRQTQQAVDKAAKKKLFHKNKASRWVSRISKLS
ncbi:30S ribosomal protein S20 [candidate division WWE3 bacterium CG08_land_8_20_14_0_20_43_13]|uniref:Small ribosomal subunit protein bS20 n=1 Tax=candidate division WWE3 bacterium CG08_land_8_20_14_0_20_43_13 TaxID=1975087 RepID=A0A2H0X883_UNCKA|nr:MAG: 30S ribosomal protein S20 [candidate division WWE3 bacterium CG08_land_8_20_14_0_20_43_13]